MGTVDQRLVARVAVHRGHQAVGDTEGVVEHLYFKALLCEVDAFAVEEFVKQRLDILNPIADDVTRDTLTNVIL